MKPVYLILIRRTKKRKDGKIEEYDDLIVSSEYMKFIQDASIVHDIVNIKTIKSRFDEDESNQIIHDVMRDNHKMIVDYMVKYRGNDLDKLMGDINENSKQVS